MTLKPIVEGAIEIIRPIAESKQIDIQCICTHEAVHVAGDGPRLQQAVWNLLSNAVKFSSNGGTVELALNKTDTHALISVSDSGVGIEPDFLPHVFERFTQADGSSTRAYGGLGLGLAIVRHIVEMHGGLVWADSKGKGRGATFGIELPLLERHTQDVQFGASSI